MPELPLVGAHGRGRSSLSIVVALGAMLATFLLGALAPAPARAATLGMSASGNGSYSDPFGSLTSVSFDASRSSTGSVSGHFSTGSGQSGSVVCLSISGNSAVVGGTTFGGPGGGSYVVFFVTDGGPNAADDTLHLNAISNFSFPTCTETADGPSRALSSGGFVVDDGSAGNTGVASAVGSGSISRGFGNATFDFDVQRDATNAVSGSFSWNDSNGSQFSGTPTCLRVFGGHATFGGFVVGPGPGPLYVLWFVQPGGAGTARVGEIGLMNQPDCTEAPPTTETITTGSVALTGGGGGGGGGGEVSAAADAFIERAPFQGDLLRFAAKRSSSGVVSGRFTYTTFGGSIATGDVSCLVVSGPDLVLGGRQPSFNGNPELWVTIWAHDGDLDGAMDTFAANGPTNIGPADCTAASPTQESVSRGQVTIRAGASDTGTVDGDGQSAMGGGSGTRTFDFTATRDAAGASSGTVSITESFSFGGGFSFSGTVRCVDIRGSEALIVAERPFSAPSPHYATFFVTDGGGTAGSGDSLAFDTYGDQEPFDCVAARTGQEEAVITGDITIGNTPPPPPPPTTGSLVISSQREEGGILAGVRYDVTGPSGFSTTVGDGDAADVEPSTGVIRLDGLAPGSYSVCVDTAPTEWWELFPGCDPATVSVTQPASVQVAFRFIPDLRIPDLTVPDSGATPRYGVYEKAFALTRTFDFIQFDRRFVEVSATFTAPSGARITVPAFWSKDYVVRAGTSSFEAYDVAPGAIAAGSWRVRFSPDEVGAYTYTIRAEDKRQPGAMSYTSPALGFQATAAVDPGQVSVDTRDRRFLRRADGTPYYPLGQDAAFEDGNPALNGTAYYAAILDSLQTAGENWTRVWMTDFNRSALEWSTGHYSGFYQGVGQYALQPAYRMDRILKLAADRGIQVQLVLNDHGQFSTYVNARWSENPYSDARGGPVPAATPQAFFTNAEAKRLFKQRLDYLVARYGAYRNVLAWELFNEVQFAGTAATNPGNNATLRAQVAAWHTEMAAYLRAIDPYDHLITSSSGTDAVLAPIWSDPNIDLVQVHDYGDPSTTDTRLRTDITALQGSTGKPVIVGEFGLGGGVTQCDVDPTTSSLPADEREHFVAGTHVHNAVWTAALSASSAGSWWWGCYLQPDAARHRVAPDFPINQRVFPALKTYLAGEDLAALDLDASGITASASVRAFGLDDGSRGFVWVRDALNEFRTGARPGDLAGRSITGASLSLAGFAGGDGTTYQVEVWDPYGAGGRLSTFSASVSSGALVVPLPAFTRDIALKIRPGGESPTASLPAGGTLTTDTEGDGATPADPLETSVTTPIAGTVSLSETTGATPPAGYGLLGQAISISAPTGSASSPLVIVFRIDASAVPAGDDETTIQVFRNGTAVPACTGATGTAAPNPCVALRERLADNDVRICVLTSAASAWLAAVPAPRLGTITGVAGPIAKGTAITLSVPLSDAGTLTGHTATWTWDDGTTSAGTIVAGAAGTATVRGSKAYATPGVFEVSVVVRDPSGQTATTSLRYVVVYDPTGGFATGSGTFVPGSATSTAGDRLPGLDGTSPADFGFVTKYKKGSTTIPEGELTFRYTKGSFELTVSSFAWLVIGTDEWARFQGTGTITGQPGAYTVRIDARDSNKATVADFFSIRVWAPGVDPESAQPLYQASGNVTGQVTIHRK